MELLFSKILMHYRLPKIYVYFNAFEKFILKVERLLRKNEEK